MARVPANQDVSVPAASAGYLTLPAELEQDFSWNGNTYGAGQEFEVTGWDPEQIKQFRDESGATFRSDDINDTFNQFSLDNLDGMSQYEFQYYGTPEQWADWTTGAGNQWYQAYGVDEGDTQAGLDLYNYYDGTQYDADGNITQVGTGKNDLAQIDFLGDYEVIGDIVGGNLSSLSEWNRGLLGDMVATEDGGYEIDGRIDRTVGDDEVAQRNLNTFQAFNIDAANKGKAEDRETDGEVDPLYDQIIDNQGFSELMPAFERQSLQDRADEFRMRELGQLYQEPSIDPDIRPRDMWSLDDINTLGIDAGAIDVYDVDGEALPSWLASGANQNSQNFTYTEGSLDNPYNEPTRESFDSAISLLGDDVQYTPYVELDEEGNAYVLENPTGAAAYDPSLANQVTPSGVPQNYQDSQGQYAFNTNLLGNPITGSSMSLIPDTYTNEFLEAEIYSGNLSGPIMPGWTDTATLAAENNWTGEDYRVFAEYVDNASYSYSSGVVNPKEEQRAIDAVEQAREDRANGYGANPEDYTGSIWGAARQALDPQRSRDFAGDYGIRRDAPGYQILDLYDTLSDEERAQLEAGTFDVRQAMRR